MIITTWSIVVCHIKEGGGRRTQVQPAMLCSLCLRIGIKASTVSCFATVSISKLESLPSLGKASSNEQDAFKALEVQNGPLGRIYFDKASCILDWTLIVIGV